MERILLVGPISALTYKKVHKSTAIYSIHLILILYFENSFNVVKYYR